MPSSSSAPRPAESRWEVVERTGTPRELHGDAGTPAGRRAVIVRPTSGAVVLGSTQPDSDFDARACAAAGLDVVRRRSGGGAVVVQPGAQVWVDFYLPRDDPLFAPDVGRSFLWLGEIWATVLRAAPGSPAPVAVVAAAGHGNSGWGRRLCYCGLARGEVTAGGKKVVGLSSRRDRSGAWFNTMALMELDVAATADLIAGGRQMRDEAAAALDASATALDSRRVSAEAVVGGLVGVLGDLGGVRRAGL